MPHRLISLVIFIILYCYIIPAYSKNYFIKTTNGIMSVITIGDMNLSDVISPSENHIKFYGEVLLQLVSEEIPSNNSGCFLAYQLFLLYFENHSFLDDFVAAGTGNYLEYSFFENSANSVNFYIISEYHLPQESFEFNAGSQVSSPHYTLAGTQAMMAEGLPEIQVTDWPCLYGCGKFLNSKNGRHDHHRNKHKDQYLKLNQKCKKGFRCKYCGFTITGLQSLGTHLRNCSKASNYLDYLD